ncbi:MAG: hypothetical protein HHJ16_11890 [Polaromonas sp.]|uniref:hypothetical protein n=1 Tax=Polaromonas sp. TaxID=1869339 RepID=UPI00184591FD|nr:hypothetical protein [Polaromonas sp.]NMM10956.1 hypothetical protein [Polaromonas sp.]
MRASIKIPCSTHLCALLAAGSAFAANRPKVPEGSRSTQAGHPVWAEGATLAGMV